jgi:hypothetical protein
MAPPKRPERPPLPPNTRDIAQVLGATDMLSQLSRRVRDSQARLTALQPLLPRHTFTCSPPFNTSLPPTGTFMLALQVTIHIVGNGMSHLMSCST